VVSVDVVDPYTVKVTLSVWDAGFIQSLSSSNGGKMVSPTAYQTMGEEAMKLHPVGTGPFQFESYEPGSTIRFTKFADYWQEGLPYLDAVEVKIVADPMVALTSFSSGEGELLYQCNPTTAETLKAEGNRINTRTLTIYALSGDSKDASCPFSDQKVREGMAYALDTNTIVNGVWGGICPPTNQLAMKGGPGYDSTIVGHPYDPVKAAQLLAESSFNITPTNRWKVKVSYIEGDEVTQTYLLMQEALAKVGIDLELNGVPVATWFEKSMKGAKNELLQMGFSYSLELQYLTSLMNQFGKDRVQMVDHLVPAEFQALIDQAIAEPDPAEREKLFQQFNKMAVDQYSLVIPLYVYTISSPVSADAHDLGFADKTIEFLPERAWLSGAANTGTTAAAATTTTGQ
jgi:ABC-type transport system substrate-binding protein